MLKSMELRFRRWMMRRNVEAAKRMAFNAWLAGDDIASQEFSIEAMAEERKLEELG